MDKVCFEIKPELIKNITEREREVLVLIANGYSCKEIAKALSLSIHTAHKHRSNIYQKTNISSAAGATRLAIQSGLIQV